MKRPLDGDAEGAADEVPAAKKVHADDAAPKDVNGAEQPEDEGADFLQKMRNRGLQLELMNKKRIISESRRELELMHKKSREMEALVSLIQRAWSQLDIDASLLLDSLGDPEAVVTDRGAGELLYRFLHAGAKYVAHDPTNDNIVPQLDGIDEYSSPEDVAKAQVAATEELNHGAPDAEVVLADGAALESHLHGHVAFTLTLLEKVCNAINDSSTQIPGQSQQAMVEAKESFAKILFLKDEISKLRIEIVALHSKLAQSEGQQARLAKRADRLTLTINTLGEQKQALQQQLQNGGGANGPSVAATGDAAEGGNGSNEQTKHFDHKIKVLERQLAESEAAKQAAEMRYTERVSRTVGNADAQLQDLRKAMEDLRAQAKQRVSTLVADNESLQTQVHDLQLALQQVEQSSAERIQQFVSATEAELGRLRLEKTVLEAKISKCSGDRATMETLKKRLAAYEVEGNARTVELKALRDQAAALTTQLNTAHDHVQHAHERELELERCIIQHNMPVPEGITVNVPANLGQEESEEGEHGEIIEPTHPSAVLLQQLSQRLQDARKEAREGRRTINDLITEIDAMSTSADVIHAQNELLNTQIGETQSLQSAILEENIRLQNDIENARRDQKEAEAKYDGLRKLLGQQEALLSQVRAEESGLHVSLQTAQKACLSLKASKHQGEQQNETFQQRVGQLEQEVAQARKKTDELVQRCQDLTKQANMERKARQEAERQAAQKPAKSSSEAAAAAAAAAAMTQDDADMLDMTLNMLKCSVCKDRFKSVAITRCFHLFCRECIEENIRNRSRKCPACGEKFGQDDVQNVYFTH